MLSDSTHEGNALTPEKVVLPSGFVREFANTVREAREAHHMTQEQLAYAVDCSDRLIRYIEDEYHFSWQLPFLLSKSLGFSLDELLK